MFTVPEKFRVTSGPLGSSADFGNNGAFEIRLKLGQKVMVIASDQMGWEHVSVSRKDRCPTWGEMCQIKAMFWGDDDCVVQYHPPKSDYINNHQNCLHLWRPIGIEMPRPPSIMVGIAS
jgi:hypothetical protein